MNIEFRKIEIASRIFLKWSYEQSENGRKTKINASADAVIHYDLGEAMEALVPHFVLLTEMKKKPDVAKQIDLKELSEDLGSKYKVTAISIDDNKGDMIYRISGYKILHTGKVVHFETPRVKRESSIEDAYEFFDNMVQQIEVIQEEVLQFMNGKEGTSSQTTMDFDDDFNPDVDQEESDEEESFVEKVA